MRSLVLLMVARISFSEAAHMALLNPGECPSTLPGRWGTSALVGRHTKGARSGVSQR